MTKNGIFIERRNPPYFKEEINMSAKNKVIAGDYTGANIAMAADKVVLNISLGNMIILNKKMV